jgi:hypothetical protein
VHGGASSGSEEVVGWGLNTGRAAVQDVGVDHRRGDILVTEQLLDRFVIFLVY